MIKSEAGISEEIPDDVKEIENYVKVVNYGFERLETLPLSLRFIREIHEILMQGVRGENKTPGEFRKSQNWIGGYSISTASYVPPSIDYMTYMQKVIMKHGLSFLWKGLLRHQKKL